MSYLLGCWYIATVYCMLGYHTLVSTPRKHWQPLLLARQFITSISITGLVLFFNPSIWLCICMPLGFKLIATSWQLFHILTLKTGCRFSLSKGHFEVIPTLMEELLPIKNYY